MRNCIFLLLIFVLLSCKSRNERFEEYGNTKLEKQKVFLQGKDLNSARKILDDSINLGNHILFLYNGFDCETCIEKGFMLAKTLDSLSGKQFVFIISTSANIGADQLRYDYFEYVYYDEHDLIRSELKYIYTPVLLYFDSLERIDEIYYSGYNNNYQDESLFIESCLNKFYSMQK